MGLNCLYCEQEIINYDIRFCSNKCKLYYNKEFGQHIGGYVYCLKNPLDNNKVFYIGKTAGTLSKRLKEHIIDKKNTEKNKVVNLILDAEMELLIEEIEFVDDISLLDEREKYWIKEYSENGLSNKMSNPKKGKSNPIGVRFDLNKLEVIQKEQNLTSAQGVLNYLLDNYSAKN